MSASWPVPVLADVAAAARRLAPFAVRTPMVRSGWLSDLVRAEVFLKLEFRQKTGAFKLRGAVNAMIRLRDARDLPGVVAASAGNHGLALAWAAQTLGVKARIHLPATAPAAKRNGIAALCAEIVESPTYDDVEAAAKADAAASGFVYLPPYNDPDVIAGAGTVALEMMDDDPDLDTIVVPIGGGGLMSGTAIVSRGRPSQARQLLIGAEAAASPVFTSALAAGHVVTVDVKPTVADGLAGNMDPDSRTFEIVRDLVDRIVLVDEGAIAAAMRGLIVHEHLTVEGAAAAAVGAVLRNAALFEGRRIGVVLSGGNVDPAVIERVR